jgi:hypothetical protein
MQERRVGRSAADGRSLVVRCERHVSLDRDASFHSGTLVRDLRKRGYGEL